jgi:hypothetical protein
MKQLIFRSVATTSAAIIQLNMAVGAMVVGVVAGCFNVISSAIQFTSKSLMRAIDSKQFEYFEQLSGQEQELGELHLLMAARRVKEDAISSQVWTVGHTIAINRIAGALHANCGWEPPRIHQYLRDVVESIPGMAYGVGDDFPTD